jgi:hypothetical protein
MDPLTVLLGPLGPLGLAGSALIAAGWIIVKLWKRSDDKDAVMRDLTAKHLADVKECGEKNAAIVAENTKAYAQLASAIERMGDRLK